ncbi:MAG: U32 family peptidase, partial [Eubacteriales bacterium]
MKKTLPELLAPAGSYRALEAALSAGADAVYFGAREFNARANAENFSDEELISAIRKLKLLGVKSNIVMNTELYENELYKALSAAERVLSAGADALIVADIGLASLIKKYFPEAQIHASTQMCGENTENAKIFASLGFSRMVAAREISFKNLKYLCENSPIETEIFVHGALCVSHSGACLMSSVIGGRSGNRGECAQPCRLPYKCRGCEYPLSLRDISLAGHITDIIDTGVASLKIEGRMKSPEYVYGVVSVYRRLLDEGRNATDEETEYLSSLFSRSGFTDGYFTENISHSMLGVRTDSDKNATLLCQSEAKKERKLKLKMRAELYAGKPLKLCGTAFRAGEEFYAETEGDTSEEARTCPLSDERIKQSLIKLGTTVFESDITDISVFSDGKSIVPISSLNASRRELCAKLEKALLGEEKTYRKDFIKETFPKTASDKKSAYFV